MIPVPIHPATNPSLGIGVAIVTLVVLAAVILTTITLVRKYLRHDSSSSGSGWSNPSPDIDNPSAFMAASMQGVIEKLRAQEKELARLHLLAQERRSRSGSLRK